MEQRLRVAIISEAGSPTGTFYYLVNLAQGLETLGCDVTLVTPVFLSEAKVKQLVLPWPIGIPILGRPSWFLSLYFRLKKHHFDVIHSAGYGLVDLLPWDIYRETLKVTTIADVMCDKREYRSGLFSLWVLAKVMQPPHIRFNDLIITTSNASKSELHRVKKIPLKSINVVYHGVSDDFKKVTATEQIKKVVKKLLLPEKFILNTGFIKANKNTLGLIRAFRIIGRQFPEVHLVFTGSLEPRRFKYHREVVEEIARIPRDVALRIRFLNYVSYHELKVLYSLASVYCMPSFEEGFGMPVLEAMRAGVPVVTSTTSCLPEVAGGAALLANPYNPEEIAVRIERLLKDERLCSSLIRKGHIRAKDFTWTRTAEETLKIYRLGLAKKLARR